MYKSIRNIEWENSEIFFSVEYNSVYAQRSWDIVLARAETFLWHIQNVRTL